MPFLIFFLIFYAGTTIVSLKLDRFRPRVYKLIEDEKKKKKWLKFKAINESLIFGGFLLVVTSLVLINFKLISQSCDGIFCIVGLVFIIAGLICNLVNNKKNAGVFTSLTFFGKF